MIGYNIKKLRLKNNLSLRDLGDKLNVSHQTISKYEKDEMMPTSEMLIKISKIFNVKVSYLFEKAGNKLELSDVHYRKKSTFTKKNQQIVEDTTKDILASYLELLDLFPTDRFKIAKIDNLKQHVNSYEEIETKAEHIRSLLNLGEDPINNLLQTLEELGFIIIFIDPIKGFDGKEGIVNDIPFIVLSRESSGDRQRFNLAHELGHLLITHEGLDDEKVAHRLAGSILVPRKTLISDLGIKRRNLNLFELRSLKTKYKVSIQCLIMRANQVGIISDYEKERLFKEIAYKGWRTNEPIQIANEVSTKFEQMVCEAVSEGYISNSKGAEYLNISTVEFLNKYMEKPLIDTN